MRTSFFITAGITCLLGVSQATSIPARDVVVLSRDVQLISPDTDIAVHNWTEYNTTSLAAVGHLDASIPQTAVVVAVIYSNAQIVSGVCAATAATGPGGVAVCGVVAITAILTSFFALFRASSGPAGDDSPVRSIAAPSFIMHDLLLPTGGCDTVCQLKANAANTTSWASVGNITVDGILHDVHFSQNGQVLGLRAVQAADSKARRDDTYDDNGVVAAYFWQDDHETAWNDFDRSQIDTMANDVGEYIVSNNAPMVCADLTNQDGAVDAGMVTVHAGDEEFALSGDSYTEAMTYCQNGE